MTLPAPKVTVGMAVYRGEAYIAEAINSVLAETFQDWELLLVNDASPDNSVEVIRSFNDPRIRLLENETNQGLVGVRNRIMVEARGTYLAWLDQDDLTLPNRLATQVAYLDANPEIAVCGSWTKMRYEALDGSVTMTTERLPVSNDQIRATMVFLNPLACNTVMMRRSALAERQLMFREQFGNTLDYDMWSNASDTMRVCNLPVALAAYRVHASQTSQGAALDLMNDQALQVQVDLIERALGIEMNDEERRIHRSATIAPLVMSNLDQLEDIARWFGRLKTANDSIGSFERSEFDRALARQWTTVVLAATRSGDSRTATLRRGLASTRQIGLPVTAIVSSASAGFTRRLARNS
jgi:glycosyltransferase involved in cell wall biosynthesis